MLPDYLAEFAGIDSISDLFLSAVQLRAEAAVRIRKRLDCALALKAQLDKGLWTSSAVAAAVAAARRDKALLWYERAQFVALAGGGHDLVIRYDFSAPGSSARLADDDFAAVYRFLDLSTPPSTDGAPIANDEPAWLGALRLEAQCYVNQLWADWYLGRALTSLMQTARLAIESTTGRDPYDPAVIKAHCAAILLFRQYGIPELVEAAFDDFRARYAGDGDPRFPWRSRSEVDKIFRDETGGLFYRLLLPVIEVKRLHNPIDTSEIEFLSAQQMKFKPPLVAQWSPPLMPVTASPAADIEQVSGTLARILEVLPDPAGRTAHVFCAWRAAADALLYRFRRVERGLRNVIPDDEALGMMVHALAGDAHYALSDYAAAQKELSNAIELAGPLLDRVRSALPNRAGDSEEFVAALAQKAGNAFFCLGDEELARQAYGQARQLAHHQLAAAVFQLNMGNLAYLGSNLVDYRGYVTLDRSEMQRLANEGPQCFYKLKFGRNARSLLEAEDHYLAALQVLRGMQHPQAKSLSSTVQINLGNTAWAWARAVESAGAGSLAQLLQGEAPGSRIVPADATPADCFGVAIAWYEKALAADDRNTGVQTTCFSNLSELYYLLAAQTGARSYLVAGLEAGRRTMDLLEGLPETTQVLQPELRWRTAYNLARSYERLGQIKMAGQLYDAAIAALEEMRAAVHLDSWQAIFLQEKLEVYEGYIRLLYHTKPAGYEQRIFEVFELTKARGFLDLLESAGVNPGVDPELTTQRDELLGQMSACNDDIRRAINAGDEQRVRALAEKQREYARCWKLVQDRIVTARRGDADLNPPLATLPKFQAFLGRDKIVALSFLIGLATSYLLVIDSTQVRVFELAGRREIELEVTKLVWYCRQNSTRFFSQFRAASEAVTRLLLGPALDEPDLRDRLTSKKLVIIPDGVLFYLPFETLLVDEAHRTRLPDGADFKALGPYYLIATSDVSYAPSASALMRLAATPVQPSQIGLLAVYNVNYKVDEPDRPGWALPVLGAMDVLSGAEQVADVLSEFARSAPDLQTLYCRAWSDPPANTQVEAAEHQSSEPNFLRVMAAAAPRYLLFAGHALYNDKYPSLSGLLFNLAQLAQDDESDAGEDSRHDGFLRLEELFQLQMRHTELTFLAACETGLGMVYRGEGITCLSRAFMYQGSPTVVASLWAVSDRATAKLTSRFFNSLLVQPGADRARLLAEAKRAAIEAGGVSSLPYQWAPFMLMGARLAPKSHQSNHRRGA